MSNALLDFILSEEARPSSTTDRLTKLGLVVADLIKEDRERIAKRIEETAERHDREAGVTLGESCLYDVCATIAREGGLKP